MNHHCETLDSYLADELDADTAATFEAHVANCAACREALAQQQWMDAMLRSPARAELEPPPPTLAELLPAVAAQRRRRVHLTACVFATAAALLIAAGWFILFQRPAPHPATPDAAQIAVPETRDHDAPTSAPPRATFVGGPDVIVVPIESRHPNVTVFQLYPTYQPRHSVQANVGQPSSADEFAWTVDFNGG